MKLIAHPTLSVAFIGAVAFHAGLASAATATLTASANQAASAEMKLPPEVAKLRPSKLPGYAIAMQKCAICHSADYVSYQPPGMSQAQWTVETAKTQHAYGAPINDDEVKQIGVYVAVVYGSAKATDPGTIAVSATGKLATVAASTAGTTAVAGASAGAAIDVKTLLNANACLSCHAIAQKIVGPSYQEVAAKYKGDAQALSKLEVSICKGSIGKWGASTHATFRQLERCTGQGLGRIRVEAVS